MADDPSKLRKVLRRAERAFGDPSLENELAADGITLGPEEDVNLSDLLSDTDDAEASQPSVTVTVFIAQGDVADVRAGIEDALVEDLERSGVGRWLGGGQGSIGDDHFFDVSFAVQDPQSAVAAIRTTLERLSVRGRVEITGSDGSVSRLP